MTLNAEILTYSIENTAHGGKYKTKVCNPEKYSAILQLSQQILSNLFVGMCGGVHFGNFFFFFL